MEKSIGDFVHSSKDIIEVINNVSDVSENTKTEVILLLEQGLLKGSETISALGLGIFFAKIYEIIEDKDGLSKIIDDVRDLDKLPFIAEKIN